MKISVFTVMLPDMTPEEAATALQETGYDGVEWRVTVTPPERKQEAPSYWGNNLCTLAPTEEDAARARRLAESAGLQIPGLGSYIAMGDLAMVEQVMAFARIAGAPQIRVGVGRTLDTHSYADLFTQTRTFLSEVVPLARQYGVKALIETHPKTIAPSASLAHHLVDGLDPEWMGVIYDPGNLVHEGYEDYRIGTQLLGPYLAHVHIKNGAFSRPAGGGVWTPTQSPLDDGVVDFHALYRALHQVHYSGWLGVEDFSGARSSRDTLQHNIAFLRRAVQFT